MFAKWDLVLALFFDFHLGYKLRSLILRFQREFELIPFVFVFVVEPGIMHHLISRCIENGLVGQDIANHLLRFQAFKRTFSFRNPFDVRRADISLSPQDSALPLS